MKKFAIVVLFSIFALVENNVMAQKNPASYLIYGTEFMTMMKKARETGNYDLMLQYTASSSIKKLGKEKIKAYYESNFTNISSLEWRGVVNNSDGTKTINYINMGNATKKATSVVVVLEDGVPKLVVTDLKKKLLN